MIGVSRTNRLKSSPPTRHSVKKQEGVAVVRTMAKSEPDLRFKASNRSHFNDIGVARGFLSPGGAPKSGVRIEYDHLQNLYLVWLNKRDRR